LVSKQDFNLSDITKSFKEDLARVSNPQAARGQDSYGLFSYQLEPALSTVSKDDVNEIIEATSNKTSWLVSCDNILKKLNLVTNFSKGEKGTIYKILISLLVSAAAKKIIILNGSYCSNHVFSNQSPDFLLKEFPFSFCYSLFALELVNVGSASRYDKVKKLLKIDWLGVEHQHLTHKTWLKTTSDVFCYMCAYGIDGYSDITPETLNEFRISRNEQGLGFISYSPAFKFIDGKYNTTLDIDTKKICSSNNVTNTRKKKSFNKGYGHYKPLSPKEKIDFVGINISKESIVLQPYARKATVHIDDYSLDLSLLSDYLTSRKDDGSKWGRSQRDYIHSDSPEAGTVKTRENALKYLNAYLFNYLPYFFNNTVTVFEYPDTPEKFLTHVFVKKSMVIDEFILGASEEKIYPLSLIDFIVLCTENTKSESTKGNNLLRDSLAIITRYFQHVVTFYGHLDGYKLSANPLNFKKGKHGTKYNKSIKTKFNFHYWIYFRHFIKVVAKHAVLHASQEINKQAIKFHLPDVVTTTDNISSEILSRIENNAVTLTSINNDKIANNIINVNEKIKFTDDLIPLVIGSVDVSSLKRKTIQLTDLGGNTKHINYQAFAELCIKCYAGQRASNAAWLCADTFDADYDPNNTSSDESLVDIRIFTDKVSPTGLESKIPKEIMELLITIRKLRNLNKDKAYSSPIYYQNNPKTNKGKLKPLLQISKNHYAEHYNLTPFIEMFEKCLIDSGIQFQSTLSYCLRNMKSSDFNYLKNIDQVPYSQAYKIKYLPDDSFVPFFSIMKKSELTGHSLRLQLVSVLDVLVDDREVIRMFTGQSNATIGYYAKNTPAEENEIINSAKDLLPELVTPIQTKIDEKEANDSLFAGTFVQDYHPISTHITMDISSGIDDLETCDELAFNWTHLCPHANNCPNEVLRTIGAMQCHICPKALSLKHHKGALLIKIKALLDDVKDMRERLKESGVSKADEELLTFEIKEKVREASCWKVRHDILKSQDLVVLDSKGVLDNMTYVEKGSFKHHLYIRLKEVADTPALQSDKIRRIADRISRKLYKVIDDLPALIDFENERLHENPVAHAIRTLEIVADYQGTTVEKLLEAPTEKNNDNDNELLGVFE